MPETRPPETPSRPLLGGPRPDIEDEHIAARVGGALFGTSPFEFAGRYHLLERLGRGGMGVVYAAYDNQLCRRVALKIIQSRVDPFTHQRAIREALALAKLAHANVVAIHDAGTHEGRIWIAMECVDGVTLRVWAALQPRSWREHLAVLVDAARGLSAIHKAGLVHRDLKPDNIMIDREGRVRVLDFGLAHDGGRAEATLQGAPDDLPASLDGGTPAYMAPEQWLGDEVGPAADQYAWCVVAWELLYGERPPHGASAQPDGQSRLDRSGVPAWLRRVLRCGLAAHPAGRFPGMDALMTALAHGAAGARRRRTGLWTVSVLLLLSGALGLHRWQASAASAACRSEGAAIAAIWNPAVRDRLRGALVDAGAEETAERVLPLLDRHAEAWRAARVGVCTDAQTHDEWRGETQERARWCLDERASEFDALVAEMSREDVRGALFALPAAAGLAPLDPCRDLVLLGRLAVPTPDQRQQVRAIWTELVRVRTLDGLGEYKTAATLALKIDEAASTLAWPPLIAIARLQLGLSLERVGRYDDAETMLQDAFVRAQNMRMFEVAVDAGVSLVRLLGSRLLRTAEARNWARHTALVLDTAEADEGLRAAALLRSESQLERAAGRLPEAESLLIQARGIQERLLGSENPAVAQTLNDLGVVLSALGEHERASALHRQVLALRERLFGADHPLIADSLNNLAIAHASLDQLATARQLCERAQRIEEDALAQGHPDAAKTLKNLANILVLTPDGAADTRYAAAQQLYERARAIEEHALGPEHPEVAATMHGLGIVHHWRGETERARELFEQALKIQERVFHAPHPDHGTTLFSLANLHNSAGRHLAAVSYYTQAVTVQEHIQGATNRDLVGTLLELASAQESLGAANAAGATRQRAFALQSMLTMPPAHRSL